MILGNLLKRQIVLMFCISFKRKTYSVCVYFWRVYLSYDLFIIHWEKINNFVKLWVVWNNLSYDVLKKHSIGVVASDN